MYSSTAAGRATEGPPHFEAPERGPPIGFSAMCDDDRPSAAQLLRDLASPLPRITKERDAREGENDPPSLDQLWDVADCGPDSRHARWFKQMTGEDWERGGRTCPTRATCCDNPPIRPPALYR